MAYKIVVNKLVQFICVMITHWFIIRDELRKYWKFKCMTFWLLILLLMILTFIRFCFIYFKYTTHNDNELFGVKVKDR